MSNGAVVDLQNATAYTQAKSAGTPKQNGGDLGKTEFLKLLMTQLQAQDPLNPQDPQAFVAQLSQFASLEQLTNMGKSFDNLVTLTGANNAAGAVSLLGKEVRMNLTQLNGPATINYELDQNAKTLELQVVDSRGMVVKRVINPPSDKGIHELKLDGFPTGNYTVKIVAKDAKDVDINNRLSIVDRVKSVNFDGQVPQLLLENGTTIPASELIEIHQPTAATTPAAANSTTTTNTSTTQPTTTPTTVAGN